VDRKILFTKKKKKQEEGNTWKNTKVSVYALHFVFLALFFHTRSWNIHAKEKELLEEYLITCFVLNFVYLFIFILILYYSSQHSILLAEY